MNKEKTSSSDGLEPDQERSAESFPVDELQRVNLSVKETIAPGKDEKPVDWETWRDLKGFD